MTLVLRYAARSDRGLVRSNNEDSVYAGARLLALADGMGGHAAGEVASQLVIAALAHLDDDEPGGDLLAKLDEAVRAGNAPIAAQVEAEPELEGMGTTLPAILFAGDRTGVGPLGDPRGSLRRHGEPPPRGGGAAPPGRGRAQPGAAAGGVLVWGAPAPALAARRTPRPGGRGCCPLTRGGDPAEPVSSP